MPLISTLAGASARGLGFSIAGAVAVGTRAGYLFGGNTANTYRNIIQQLNFSTEVNTTISATLSNSLWQMGAFANSGVAGYSCGGSTGPSLVATVDKLNFVTTTKSTVNSLPSAASGGLANANSGVAGYIMAGQESTSSVTSIKKLTFSADTWSTISAVYPAADSRASSCANSGTAGYGFGSGIGPGSPGTGIAKLLYSNETVSTLSATLLYGNYTSTANSNNAVAGYHHGGYNGNMIVTINKLAYSNDTVSQLANKLASTYSSADAGSYSNSGTAGYVLAGYDADGFSSLPASTNISVGSRSQINKITYSTDAVSVISATTPYSNTNDHNGCANSAGL